jgi:primary-amine oxidase
MVSDTRRKPGGSGKDLSPLDGLTAGEYKTVAEVLAESGKVDNGSRFVVVNLAEPHKQQVLAWTPGDPIERRAAFTAHNLWVTRYI